MASSGTVGCLRRSPGFSGGCPEFPIEQIPALNVVRILDRWCFRFLKKEPSEKACGRKVAETREV